jgi:hypothetical protein
MAERKKQPSIEWETARRIVAPTIEPSGLGSLQARGSGVMRTKRLERFDHADRIHPARVLAVFSAWS